MLTIHDLRGLTTVKSLIRRLSEGESGAQAILIYGSEGSGKSTAAAVLARSWLCKTPGPDGGCGECAICRSAAEDRAVDLQVAKPWGKGRLIKLGVIREVPNDPDPFEGIPLLEFFRTRPLMANNKVMVLEDVERLNSRAANALLKTLEEPPSYGRLILTTSHFGTVLPTIRSRCICVSCEVPKELTVGGEPLADWEGSYVDTPGRLAFLREHKAVYLKLDKILSRVEPGHVERALGLSADMRSSAGELAKVSGMSSRDAHCEILRALGLWTLKNLPDQPQVPQAVARAFRLIQGNGNPSIVFDSLFCSVLE